MLKKRTILSVLSISLAVTVFAFLSVSAKTNRTGILSKKSHAERLWQTSGHADAEAEAFTHWDEDSPAEIPTTCAKCHSRYGFFDFLLDGTVDAPAAIGTTVDCLACHIDEEHGVVRDHTAVTFPSGALVENLGHEALCMECHQGRESTVSVNNYITAAGLADDDTPSTSLSARNSHYFVAAATQLGTVAQGGYEYEGKSYDARFSHITGYNACITCHDPHSLEIDLDRCSTCHSDTGPKNIDFPGSFFSGLKDPKNIRYYGSFVDYDGDGNMEEGIYYEIQGFLEKLYEAIQAYALNVAGNAIVYDEHAYPYFFKDTNGNGLPDADETTSANRYRSFTARLIRAAYNYQFAKKDPAGYAHGGKYIIELLYDSIEDLKSQLAACSGCANVIDMTKMHRTDEGHFDGSAEAWRHWDADGEVSASCSKCHSAKGLAYFLENGTTAPAEISNGMLCTTCHTSPPHVRASVSVTFPSGAVKSLGDNSNICLNCHQGRASKLTVDQAIASGPGPYSFINIHYFPAASVMLGSEIHGGYEYDGKTYAGQRIWPNHNGRFGTCIECHMGKNGPRRIIEAGNTLSSSPSQTYFSTQETGPEGRLLTGRKQTLKKSSRIKNRTERSLNNTDNSTYGDHNVHKPNPADCVYCHGQDISQPNPGADPVKFLFSKIRPASTPDYDGDGNRAESVGDEIQGLQSALYAQIQSYAANVLLKPIVYDESAYPYVFNDTNGNGVVDPGENTNANRYRYLDAAMLKATYNYHLTKKEPHCYLHNSLYTAQLLVDSIENLGGNVAIYTWR